MSSRLPFARWVSIIGHPFVMIALMVGAMTAHTGGVREIGANIALVCAVTCVPVAILIIRQVRRGAWANADASRLQERPSLYLTGISAVLALVLLLLVIRPGSLLLRGSLSALGLLVACAMATRWIKVSLHMAAATMAASALILQGSLVGWGVAATIPVLAWSRLTMKRHKPLEVALGLVFGAVAGVAMHFP